MIFYCIGRYGLGFFQKETTADTSQKKTFIHKLDHLIHKNLVLALFVIKFTPYAPPIGLTYIGKIGISPRRYFIASVFLCLIGPTFATIIGFHLGSFVGFFQKYSGVELAGAVFGGIVFIALIIMLFIFLKNRSQKILENTED